MIFVNLKSFGRVDESEVFHLIAEEGTLIHLESDASFGDVCEDFVNVSYVLVNVFRVNDNVIYIDDAVFPFEFSYDHVERAMICRGCVC